LTRRSFPDRPREISGCSGSVFSTTKKKFGQKSVLFKSHFSDFSEHQITGKGVQEFSIKTVTLEIFEQLESMRNEFQNNKIGFRSEKFQKKQSFRSKNVASRKYNFSGPEKGLAVAASLFS